MFSNSILQQLCIVCTCTVLSRSVVSDSLRPRGLQPTRLLCPWGFARQEYWSGLPCLPPGDPPNPGIEPRSSALQADSSPAESQGNPSSGVGSQSLLQQFFLTQESNQGVLNCRWVLYQLSYQGSPCYQDFQGTKSIYFQHFFNNMENSKPQSRSYTILNGKGKSYLQRETKNTFMSYDNISEISQLLSSS